MDAYAPTRAHALMCLLCDQTDFHENLRAQAFVIHTFIERLVFIQRLKHDSYVAHMQMADLFQDTLAIR